ncbi:hypothetical protein BHM03_00049215 [Ensete ventricosum]|nr:hypothetical protein BHM03_00049215 [Ensete ventricosum]
MLRWLPRRVCHGRGCRGGLGIAVVDLEEIGAFAAFCRFSPLVWPTASRVVTSREHLTCRWLPFRINTAFACSRPSRACLPCRRPAPSSHRSA